MEIVFAKLAQLELDEARRYYERQQRGLGVQFMREAATSTKRIGAQPLAWQIEVEPVRRFIFNRFPYKMLYAVLEERIVVLAVAHQHRDPEYWVDRMSP